MEQKNLLPLIRLAKAGRWLFWISVTYAALWSVRKVLLDGFYHINPQARSTAWGRFKWYFPADFEQVMLIAPLVFLYLFQSRLLRGCARQDEVLIQKGLYYLYGYLISLLAVAGAKTIFEFFIEPYW